MTSQDFLHLPCTILGDDTYKTLIDKAINEAKAASDNETMQKNIVSFRYWEAVRNSVMSNPAQYDLGYESIRYTPEQVEFFNSQYEAYRGLISGLNPPIAPVLGFGGAVLVEAA
jgi:hypothetical protein